MKNQDFNYDFLQGRKWESSLFNQKYRAFAALFFQLTAK